MTILVFTSGILTIATETWAATELRDAAKPLVQVHVLGSPVKSQCNLDMDMAEFLSLVADGGRVVDLRGLQEQSRPDPARGYGVAQIMRDLKSDEELES